MCIYLVASALAALCSSVTNFAFGGSHIHYWMTGFIFAVTVLTLCLRAMNHGLEMRLDRNGLRYVNRFLEKRIVDWRDMEEVSVKKIILSAGNMSSSAFGISSRK